MKNNSIILFLFIVLAACKNDINLTGKKEKVNNVNYISKQSSVIIVDSIILIKKKIDSIETNTLIITKNNRLYPKYPTLMLIYNGCSGSVAYNYNKRKYKIELIREYPDCPEKPNSQSPKGIYFSKLPKNLSVCYKNFLIQKMEKHEVNYLELYNKQFHSNLKIIKPTLDVFYPVILTRVTGNGGSTTYYLDTLSKVMKKRDVMHYHYQFPDPNDCLGGDFISELPVGLSDSIIIVINDYMKLKYPKYKSLYNAKYNTPIDKKKL